MGLGLQDLPEGEAAGELEEGSAAAFAAEGGGSGGHSLGKMRRFLSFGGLFAIAWWAGLRLWADQWVYSIPQTQQKADLTFNFFFNVVKCQIKKQYNELYQKKKKNSIMK